MKISIDNIVANPNRNFDIYPIDEAQVVDLMESYEEVGDFGSLPVRRVGDTFELAAGHHRLEAMKRLGYVDAEVVLADYDDDDMIRIMALENSRQKGHNSAASLDSLAAVISRVAYLVFISTTADDMREVAPNAFKELTEQELGEARKALIGAKGIGFGLVSAYTDKMFKELEYKQLLIGLKDSGMYAKIITEQQAIVEAELAAVEEAERQAAEEAERQRAEQLKKEEAARKAAQRAKKAAEEAQKKAEELKKKADIEAAARKKQQAEEAAEKQKKLAALRKKAAAEEKARIEKAKAAAKLRQQAREARDTANERKQGLHPDVLSMLKTDDHLNEFRRHVVNSKWFPLEEQPDLVRHIQALAENGKVTRALIKSYFNEELLKRDKHLRDHLRDLDRQIENSELWRKVDNRLVAFRESVKRVAGDLRRLQEVVNDDVTGHYAFRELSNDHRLTQELKALEAMVRTLRDKLRTQASTTV